MTEEQKRRLSWERRPLGHPVMPAGIPAVALGQRKGGPALLTGMDRALDARHRRPLRCLAPSRVLTRASSGLAISDGRDWRRLRLGDFFSRMWVEKARRPLTFPVAVTRKRFLAPEWVFIFGMSAVQ